MGVRTELSGRNVVPFGEYHILLEGLAWLGDREMKPYSMRFVVEYHILLEGLAWLGDREMKPYSMRFVVGDDSSTPLTSGHRGRNLAYPYLVDQVIRG